MDTPEKHADQPTVEKTILTLDSGRMVIFETVDESDTTAPSVVELARSGKEEGYARATETAINTVNDSEAPGLILRILVRPGIHARTAGRLAAVTAVAVLRAIERLSDIDISIRWVNDLYCGARKLAAVITNAQIKPNGILDYAVIRIAIALDPEDFPPKLGDVLRQVFYDEGTSLSNRLAKLIVREFFTVYDDMMLNDLRFMEEYRSRSLLLGRRVKVLNSQTNSYVPGRVVDINDNAQLVVQFKNGEQTTVSSRSELL